MSHPLVSIIVCTHNRSHYLKQTMESIFEQRYQPVEILIVDDGSTDKTKELIASYGDKVQYHWQEQQGIAAARNTACQLAKGELIAFQDDDDLMAPDRIVSSYDALCKHPVAIFATGDFALIDPDGNLTGWRHLPGSLEEKGGPALIEDAYSQVLWPKIPATPITTLFRKSDGERIGWFDVAFRYASSDKDFYARLSRLGPIVYVREIMSYVRRGHQSIWANQFRAMYSRIQLLDKHLKLLSVDDGILRERLRERMLYPLKTIASYNSRGMITDEQELQNLMGQALSQLTFSQRLSYNWYRSVKLPIRNLIVRNKTAR